ncbi:MAG: aminotransferase [Oceanobacter sp.]|nr:MAG: aminotransferase [Oceanobacter sp.]
MKKKIEVTKPFLPPLEEFLPYLERIWESRVLTNAGPLHQEFESRLAEYLGVEHISVFSNGTLALITAIKALGLSGEVITTPYSFVATTHALVWNGLTPVFADVDKKTCNLDPDKIEKAITCKTSAILPVHCYGVPCDIDSIQRIAEDYRLKVIYDAAHAFGVKVNQRSILSAGNYSVLSFHATKVFNTFEGGAIVSASKESKQRIDRLKNFGFIDEVTVLDVGINGKMNELQAAMGLLQLSYFDSVMERREKIYKRYVNAFSLMREVDFVVVDDHISWNYAYFPIFVGGEGPALRDAIYALLKNEGINARRYFFPVIHRLDAYKGKEFAPMALSNAERLGDQVICLPIYDGLGEEDQDHIISIVRNFFLEKNGDGEICCSR